MDITELLERAVADVVPAERRPTDAVLRLADSRRLRTRLRKALAGLVGLVVIGGGAVVVATGSDDGDRRDTDTPRPLTLQVELPDGWSEVREPRTIDCTTEIAPRTIYRDAVIGDLGYCRPNQPISVTGPSLLIGQIPADVAETLRAVGTPVEAGGVPGYATSYDAAFTYVVWLPAGSTSDLAFAAVSPPTPDGVQAYEDQVGGGSPGMPQELVDLVGKVTAKGDLPTDAVLPEDVAAVDLRISADNVAPAPGARVLDPGAVRDVVDAMAAPRDGATGCGPTEEVRTMHLQDARSHRWVRVDVLDDGAGCRTIYSELGGRRRIGGDPVAVATDRAEAQVATIGPAASTVQEHGLSVAVPEGWQVVRGDRVDPCTLPGPSVVVAAELAPSCFAAQYARPTHPFIWVTSTRLEALRAFTNDRSVVPVDQQSPAASVRWTDVALDTPGGGMTGLLGVPESGTGRLFVVGLDQQGSLPLRQTVEPG